MKENWLPDQLDLYADAAIFVEHRVVYTIGHSTHSIGDFVHLLQMYDIKCLVDVRSYPASRKQPQFTKERLSGSLIQSQITYDWIGALLGGYRKGGYAKHMTTEAFCKGVECLEQLATKKPTAIMCSELLFFRCHRRFIADALTAGSQTVLHIMAYGKLHKHKLLEADE